jgi:hypothetical protein
MWKMKEGRRRGKKKIKTTNERNGDQFVREKELRVIHLAFGSSV